MIPYGRQDISSDDIQAVITVLRSEFLTQGPVVPAFEKSVTDYCGAAHAVAVNSATSALHLACLALGVGTGDRVWTSPITFVATANCALYCGAQVDFIDIDPATHNLSVESLARKLEAAGRLGLLPKVVIPVHFSGEPCDMKAIGALGKRYGFRIIEDASHAIGARYRDEPVGGCRFSDITVFSFHPVKIITTGEGGMALTNDQALARRMQILRSHGITRDASEMTDKPDGPWYYQQLQLGFNYRMTDLQAALGLSQMTRLQEFVTTRQMMADRYNTLLVDAPVKLPRQHPDCSSATHLYVIRLKLNEIRRTHREVFEALREGGIGVNLHYIPVYRQPYYRALGYAFEDCPNAEAYYSEALSLPMYASLSEGDQLQVVRTLEAALI